MMEIDDDEQDKQHPTIKRQRSHQPGTSSLSTQPLVEGGGWGMIPPPSQEELKCLAVSDLAYSAIQLQEASGHGGGDAGGGSSDNTTWVLGHLDQYRRRAFAATLSQSMNDTIKNKQKEMRRMLLNNSNTCSPAKIRQSQDHEQQMQQDQQHAMITTTKEGGAAVGGGGGAAGVEEGELSLFDEHSMEK